MSSTAFNQATGSAGLIGISGPTGATGPALTSDATFPQSGVLADGTSLANFTTPFLGTTTLAIAAGVFVGSAAAFTEGLYSAASFAGPLNEVYATIVTEDAAASGGEQVMLYAVDSNVKATADGYACEFHDTGSAVTLYRIASGVTAAVAGAFTDTSNYTAGVQAGMKVNRSGANPVISIYRNGTLIQSFTDVSPPAIGSGALFIGMEVGKSVTITIDNFGGGVHVNPAGVTGPSGVTGPTGTVTGPTGETGSPPDISSGVGGFSIFQLTADVTMQNALTNLTGLVFTFAATGTYSIDLFLRASAAATTTGFGLAIDTSVAVDYVGLQFFHELAAAGTVSGGDSIADNAARGLSSGVQTANAVTVIRGHGVVDAAASGGTAQLRGQAEVAANVTFKAGSFMIVTQIA